MIKSSKFWRYAPLAFILFLMLMAYVFDIYKYFMFDELRQQHQMFEQFVAQYPYLAPFLFILIYIVVVALSLPGAALLSLAGGFLFPQPYSTIYVVIGATIGAVLIFLAAKTALGDSLRLRAGILLQKLEEGFQENATSYLLFLRLVPVFPFWLVNIAAAVFYVPLRTFALTTFIGIIPGAFVFTQAGTGIDSIFETKGEFSFSSIFTTNVNIALIALAIFALIPVVYKKIKERQQDKNQ